MALRRWCVAWNGAPFCVVIDSRHFTKWTARLRLACTPHADRLLVVKVVDAERIDREVWETTRARTAMIGRRDSWIDGQEALADVDDERGIR